MKKCLSFNEEITEALISKHKNGCAALGCDNCKFCYNIEPLKLRKREERDGKVTTDSLRKEGEFCYSHDFGEIQSGLRDGKLFVEIDPKILDVEGGITVTLSNYSLAGTIVAVAGTFSGLLTQNFLPSNNSVERQKELYLGSGRLVKKQTVSQKLLSEE